MPAREAWGLDIGQTALHAVKVRRTKGHDAEVADLYYRDLGTEPDDPAYQEKMADALEAFAKESKVGKTPVFVSLPGFSTLFREFNLPAASVSRLDEIVSYEAKQLIPYPLEEVIYDYHRLRVDMETGEITIALVCCRRDIIGRLLETLDEVGLNVEGLQVGPVALVNYVLYDTPPEETALILDTGARGTDFIVLSENSFWLRSIGISGTDLSKALMGKFSIPYERAEALKHEMGDSKQADRVFRVMSPVLNNLCAEVQRSVGYYKSLFRGVNITEILCVGNTYLLAGVDQFVADNVGLPTRTLTPPETLSTHFSVDPGEVDAHRQVLGTAAGLALQGVGLTSVNINLLPRERLVAKTVAAKLKWAAAAVGLMFLAVMVNLLTAGGQDEKFVDLKETANTVNTKANKAKNEFKKIQEQFPTEIERSRALANVSSTRGYLLKASAEVLAPMEAWNKQQSELITGNNRAHPAVEAKEKQFAKLYSEWLPKVEALKTLEPTDPQYKRLTENLEGQIRRRLDWQYDRLRLLFYETLECKIGTYGRLQNKQNPQDVKWVPAGYTNPNQKVYTYKEVPVVDVNIAGFMVFTAGRTTTDQAQFIHFKDGMKATKGVIADTFKYSLRTAGLENTIRLPQIVAPKPPSDTEPEGPKTVTFESVQEPVGRFTINFKYR